MKLPILNFCNYPSISTSKAGCYAQLQSCSPPSSGKVLRTTVSVGKPPMSPVHSSPKGLFRIPGHQPSASPLSKVYPLPWWSHSLQGSVCICVFVGCEHADLVNKWYSEVVFPAQSVYFFFSRRKPVPLKCCSRLCFAENTLGHCACSHVCTTYSEYLVNASHHRHS